MSEVPATPEEVPAPPRSSWWRISISDKAQFVVTSFVTQGLRILTTLAMARLVTKAEYGIVTLAASIPALVANFGDMGVARSLVQLRDDPREEIEDSALVLAFAGGMLLLVMSVGSGFFLAWYMHSPQLVLVGAILGITMLISKLYEFQMACLNRDLKFCTEARQNLIFSLATMTTGVSLAFAGWGIYALLLQPLVAQLLANWAIFRHHRLHWPQKHSRHGMGKLLNYGWRVTLAQYASNIQQTVVNLFVGFAFPRTTADSLLGIFGRATQIRDLIGQNISSSFDRVLYPVLRTAVGEHERVRSVVLRGICGVSLLCVFAWAWMTVTAPELIRTVLGADWVNDVPGLLRAVAPALLFNGPILMAIVVTHAMGKPLIWLRSSIVTIVLLAVGIGCGNKWGVEGIAIGVTWAQVVGGLVLFEWARRAIDLPITQVLRRLGPLALAGAISFGVMFVLGTPVRALGDTMAHSLARNARSVDLFRSIIYLVLVSSAGLVVYLLAVWVIARESWMETRAAFARTR